MKLLTAFMLLTICLTASGQAKATKKPRTLTYYTFGMIRGNYVDTESLYGFRMKWKGCIVKNWHVRHNKRVERKINKRLGENWLAQNINKLDTGYQNED